MRLMPSNLVTLSRLALIALVASALAIFLGPLASLMAMAPVSAPLFHAITYYVVAAAAFAAFPRLRRSDICAITVVMGGLIEVLQLMTGRHAQIANWLADSAGVLVLYAPGKIEHLRHLARKHAYTSFGELHARDRRKSRKKKVITSVEQFPAGNLRQQAAVRTDGKSLAA
ncbi:VanZ family protein [soil metagenome]